MLAIIKMLNTKLIQLSTYQAKVEKLKINKLTSLLSKESPQSEVIKRKITSVQNDKKIDPHPKP